MLPELYAYLNAQVRAYKERGKTFHFVVENMDRTN